MFFSQLSVIFAYGINHMAILSCNSISIFSLLYLVKPSKSSFTDVLHTGSIMAVNKSTIDISDLEIAITSKLMKGERENKCGK